MKADSFPAIIFSFIMLIFAMAIFIPSSKGENKAAIGKQIQVEKLFSLRTSQNFRPPEVFVLHVFATWCAACKRDIEQLELLGNKYKVYGLLWKDNENKAISYHKSRSVYNDILVDQSKSILMGLGIKSVPETFVIGKDGRIIYNFRGPLTKDIINNGILPKLEQRRIIQPK